MSKLVSKHIYISSRLSNKRTLMTLLRIPILRPNRQDKASMAKMVHHFGCGHNVRVNFGFFLRIKNVLKPLFLGISNKKI